MRKKMGLKNNGSALPLVIVAIVILLTMGTSLLSMGLSNRIFTLRNTSDIVARCAADAGLTQALFEMNQNLQAKTWSDYLLPSESNLDLSDTDATYSYKVTGSLLSGYTITSIGKSNNAQRIISAQIGLQGIFDHAILTKKDLILKSGTIIDGYNSNDKSDSDNNVKIGTQSTDDDSIVLNSGVFVNGDVAVGLGGAVEDGIKDLGAKVTGDKYVATIIEPIPDVTAPVLPDKKTSLSVKSGTLTLTSADSGTYTEIDLQKGKDASVLEIAGGENVELHITGDIELDQACEIVVRDGATLTIYVDGDIHCREGSGINTETPPEEAATLQLFATGEDKQYLDIKAKSDWTGTIYGPDADVVLYAGGDVYGSIVADSFEFKNGGNFYYDEALREVTITDPGVRFVVTKWNEGKIDSDIQDDFDSQDITKIGVLKEVESFDSKDILN